MRMCACVFEDLLYGKGRHADFCVYLGGIFFGSSNDLVASTYNILTVSL